MADPNDPFAQSSQLFGNSTDLAGYDPFGAQAAPQTKTLPKQSEPPAIPAPQVPKTIPRGMAPERPALDFKDSTLTPSGPPKIPTTKKAPLQPMTESEKAIAAREMELAKREKALEKREKALAKGGDAPNFPPFVPIIHHSIMGDFDSWYDRVVIVAGITFQLLLNWIFFVNLIAVLLACIVLLWNDTKTFFFSFTVQIVSAFVLYLSTTPIAFFLWYRPLYSAMRYSRPLVMSWVLIFTLIYHTLSIVLGLGLLNLGGLAMVYDFWGSTFLMWVNAIVWVGWVLLYLATLVLFGLIVCRYFYNGSHIRAYKRVKFILTNKVFRSAVKSTANAAMTGLTKSAAPPAAAAGASI